MNNGNELIDREIPLITRNKELSRPIDGDNADKRLSAIEIRDITNKKPPARGNKRL